MNIPASMLQAEAAGLGQRRTSTTMNQIGKRKARILVVDDDPQIRRVMRVTLTSQGYEIDDAKDGESALEKVRAQRFDLVLLDMNMPGMGGLEACRSLRRNSEIAIIMLTVRDSEADIVEALNARDAEAAAGILERLPPEKAIEVLD